MSKLLPTKLSVWYLAASEYPEKVGETTLVPGNRLCSFTYSDAWIDKGFALSPDMSFPTRRGAAIMPPPGFELPGAIEDAMPDRWGRQAISAIDRPARLSPLDYLYYAGDRRFGALGFSADPDHYAPHDVGPLPFRDSIEKLDELVRRIISKEPVDDRERLLLGSSRTMGGARPKLLVDLNGEEWLAKFPRGDVVDLPLVEHASLVLARSAGINASESATHFIGSGHVLLVKRFDRANGQRQHALSARTMLQPTGEISYASIADCLRQSGTPDSQIAERHELFKRMVFNILIDNTDDHDKNHAFLRDEHGMWFLSPAYDVLPQMLGLGAHGIDIGAHGLDGTFLNALSVCGRFGLTIDEAVILWREVAKVVDTWKDVFSAQRVTGADIDYIASFLDSADKLAMRAPNIANVLGKRSTKPPHRQ